MKTPEQLLPLLIAEVKVEALGPYPKYEMIEKSVRAFIRDGVLIVSAEDGPNAADYYGEYRGGCPWINPKLEAWAEKHGCFWEWRDPGSIALYAK